MSNEDSMDVSVAGVAQLASRAQIDEMTTKALLAFVARLEVDRELLATTRSIFERASGGTRGEATPSIAAMNLDVRLGNDALLLYLLVALLQIPAGDARHRANNVAEDISRETWRDLALWCIHFRDRVGALGITLEIFDWAQYYLRGEVYRVRSLQFELRGFDGPLYALRHRTTGELRMLASAGVALTNGGRSVPKTIDRGDPGLRYTTGTFDGSEYVGHPIEDGTATVSKESVALSRDEWEIVLSPGTAMLDMHIPADSKISLEEFVSSTLAAMHFFAGLRPDTKPAGIFGEAWLLDPQIRTILPNHVGLAAIQGACSLYPARIPQAKTIRRIFGPSATRESVVVAPREKMNSLQRALASFLSVPENVLCSAGGFVLNDRIAALEKAVRGV